MNEFVNTIFSYNFADVMDIHPPYVVRGILIKNIVHAEKRSNQQEEKL